MDCETFFEAVDRQFGERYEQPTRTTAGGQCVVDFYHPRVVERLGVAGLATRFNQSGVVWVPEADRLGVQLRVPAAHDDAVTGALAAAPVGFERTDHRGVAAPDGEMVTVLHYSARAGGLSRAEFDATLAAVDEALAV